MRGRAGLCLLAGLLACVELPPPLNQEGDPCRTLTEVCAGEDTVLTCEVDRWVSRTCEEVCAATGPGLESLGCEPNKLGDEACACAPPSGGCEPGEASCASEQILDLCTQDWEWMEFECAEVCSKQDARLSLGCVEDTELGPACSCTFAGASCEGELPRCVDEGTLASCEAGGWAYRDCTVECGEAGGACAPLGAEGPSCSCS